MQAAPDKLRADLRRHYGLNLSHPDIGVLDLADLAANLPQDSMAWAAVNPQAEWTTGEWMTARMIDALEFIAWTKTKESTRKGARWKTRLARPGKKHHDRKPATTPSWSIQHIDMMLSLPRTA
ncbi:hypothetical protein [Bifidobacterium phasiani]|uniref:Transposase n=1 Tax=Bifidobacterium phasiani TaxID=2834431 RepID=A0ABS6W725_9BIFI|nr:hypothetical protein [Bifidobacterium phasiani]MBW3081965.1 hypothetical protein [Bifidobacterium phasiani]